MMIKESVLNTEKQYLEDVKELIREEIKDIKKQANIVNEEISLRKKDVYFMPLSDDPEITDEMNNINNIVDHMNKRIGKIYSLEKSLNNPYFGKIIVNGDQKYKAYIGVNTVEKDYNYYVYDWRSPIASVFYNYGLGKAEYSVDSKRIECEVLEKYQFKIKNGELIRCFPSEINIDDDYLQELLSTSNSEKLGNIINTIQKGQNEIIRDESNNNIIVQGVAGSGKTVVAMHRIAYLLYKNKDLLSNNILILSPNNIFLEYISNVLPEMGEENTLATTFDDFSKKYLKKEVESYSDFLSRISDDYNKEIDFKLNDRNKLEKYLKEYLKSFKFTRKFTIKDVTFHSNEINELFNEKYKRLCFSDRINKIVEYVILKLELNYKKYKSTIKKYLYSKINISTNIYEIYNSFLEENGYKKIDEDIIRYEDICNLLFIYFYINGYEHYNNIKYIVIDEAQDYNMFQVEILSKIFKYSNFIILGDINQNINPYNNINSLEDFSKFIDNNKYIELKSTYRSTKDIVEYSNKVLGINNSIAIRKSNEEIVEEKEYSIDNIINDIDKYKSIYSRIAVITEDKSTAKKIHKEIKKSSLIVNNNDTINSNVVVIPSYLAKGLEFDFCLVIYDTDLYEKNKNLFYTALTRAKSKLIVYKN